MIERGNVEAVAREGLPKGALIEAVAAGAVRHDHERPTAGSDRHTTRRLSGLRPAVGERGFGARRRIPKRDRDGALSIGICQNPFVETGIEGRLGRPDACRRDHQRKQGQQADTERLLVEQRAHDATKPRCGQAPPRENVANDVNCGGNEAGFESSPVERPHG